MLSSMQVMFATIGVVVRRLLDVFDLPEEPTGGAPYPTRRAFVGSRILRTKRTIRLARRKPANRAGRTRCARRTERRRQVDARGVAASLLRTARRPDLGCRYRSARSRVALVAQPRRAGLSGGTRLRHHATRKSYSDQADRRRRRHRRRVGCVRAPRRLSRGCRRVFATRLGQRGFRLSGGERQRLCLARALLQQPEIMILDEALSGVDVVVERSVLAALRVRLRGRTLLADHASAHVGRGFRPRRCN